MFPVQSSELRAFLGDENLLPDVTTNQNMFDDLLSVLDGTVDESKASSISMIDTKLKVGSALSTQFCIIDTGGTRLRVYYLRKKAHSDSESPNHEAAFTVETCVKTAMPGTGQGAVPIGCQEFIQGLVDQLLPVLRRMEAADPSSQQPLSIKFSFSYPTLVDENEEVRPIRLTKEIKASELVGFPLKSELINGLKNAGVKRPISLTILNDTVAVYFAGVLKIQQESPMSLPLAAWEIHERNQTDSPARKAGSQDLSFINEPLNKQLDSKQFDSKLSETAVMGVVYGTGFNICYQDMAGSQGKTTIFNTEIGGYNGFPMTDIDVQLDQYCDNPGEGLAEKRISGSYLPRFFKETLIRLGESVGTAKAAQYGFSQETLAGFRALRASKEFPTNNELAKFLKTRELAFLKPYPLTPKEITFLQELVAIMVRRSAFHAAILTVGVALRIIKHQAVRELIITLEGGLVQNFPKLLETYEYYVKKWLFANQVGLRIVFMENAVPLGATLAKWQSES